MRDKVRGIILLGGTGSRLKLICSAINKHMLPIYDKPMFFYPVQALTKSGIDEIFFVLGGNNPGEFIRLIGNGSSLGIRRATYAYQDKPLGIANALSLAKEWAEDHSICVILGDNVINKPLTKYLDEFKKDTQGARIFVKNVSNPEKYGVVEIDKDDKILNITEKPANPKSNLIATGIYLYDNKVWEHLENLKPSKRNEFEITDLNNIYLKDNRLKAFNLSCEWFDAGDSIDSYLDTNIQVRKLKKENKFILEQ